MFEDLECIDINLKNILIKFFYYEPKIEGLVFDYASPGH